MSKSSITSFKVYLTILVSLSLINATYCICNESNCPSSRGFCNSNNQCICQNNYITVNNEFVKSNGVSCNYHLKSRYIALLLEFFLVDSMVFDFKFVVAFLFSLLEFIL